MSSTDYLDKIAPKTPARGPFQFTIKNILLISAGVIALVIVAVIIANAIGAKKTEPWQQLSIRLTNTEKIAKDSRALIKNSQLRSLNSEVSLYITNTQRDLTPVFKSANVAPKQIPAAVSQKEAHLDKAMNERLENARFNAKYDSTYAREMSYQLSTLLALYQQLYSQSGPTTKTLLTTAYDSLQPIQKATAEFSASNE